MNTTPISALPEGAAISQCGPTRPRRGLGATHRPPIGTSGTCREQDSGAAISAAAEQLSPVAPASREKSLMSAARSGKFSKTDFKKSGFAAAGPEHERSECEGDLSLWCAGSHKPPSPTGTCWIPSQPVACQYAPCRQRGTGGSIFAGGLWGPKGCAGPLGRTRGQGACAHLSGFLWPSLGPLPH
jgi:hypothetical protein